MHSLAMFISLSAFVIVTPGPDTALIIRNTLHGGRVAGVSAALGVAIGQMLWALFTSCGILGILTAFRPLFVALRLAGAAYLLILGIRTMQTALNSSSLADVARPMVLKRESSVRISLQQGLICNLSNPKMVIFFASLLPQFVPTSHDTFVALLMRGWIFSLMTIAWLITYSVAASRIGGVLRRERIRRVLEGVSGAALVGLGLRIATEHLKP